ncbi:transposase ISPsy2 [Pseudomonas fluorescens HK44]|uniref:Transposase ISPsy2 n=1 Tax=Pseudomonas fluorescens HK44 TaxID=1042209 RepID=A0A010RJ67_PSEFL|nr:transposase ISPsy2 [Pseudomonas fluorescens HK44]
MWFAPSVWHSRCRGEEESIPLFRVIKRQFGYVKTRLRGLTKNTAQLVTLFALSNVSDP